MFQSRTQPKYKYPHEVFSDVCKINSFHDRVAFLQANQSFAIRTILQGNFSSGLKFDLPEGVPPFVRDNLPFGHSMGRIDKSIKVLSRLALIEGQTPSVGLSRIKKETNFIQLLESVNEKDADVIIAMKDKKLTAMFPMIDETLVRAAFPDLI